MTLRKAGGGALILGGGLFLAWAVLSWVAGPPPSTGEEILAWASAGRTPIAFANEILFFAVIALMPAAFALHRDLAEAAPVPSSIGAGILAVTIPVLAGLDIIQGRLVFPVYGVALSAPAAELVVTLFYGGIHAVGILFGLAAIVLSAAMARAGYGRPVVVLGVASGVLDVVGSYPWLIGPVPALVCRGVFASWLMLLGACLSRP